MGAMGWVRAEDTAPSIPLLWVAEQIWGLLGNALFPLSLSSPVTYQALCFALIISSIPKAALEGSPS